MSVHPPSNRLSAEKSPYLQQHATNPVDWYPWGPEAFEAARRLNRPIFLSVGYSTCHWCHVMAHESFESEEIAALLNAHFINIKVDREERPDVDALYMATVQMMTGSGGWPMSVWLTPDLKPFFAGTYFAPDDRYGRPAFRTVIERLASLWKEERPRALEAAGQVGELLKDAFERRPPSASKPPPAPDAVAAVRAALSATFDPREGGFSGAPKFPMPIYLEFLAAHHRRTGDAASLEMASFTFSKMIAGGVYDQLGGGFARYSTDARWIVPHFEKMLYDNAQLVSAGALLYRSRPDAELERAMTETIDYLNRDLRHPEGAFYSAEDADSEGKEGTFYLWTLAGLRSVLGEHTELAARRYGVSAHGNFMDPHTREAGQNVLTRALEPAVLAEEMGRPLPEIEARLGAIRERLFEARSRRPRPHRDEKILTEWNGLAIRALALASRTWEKPAYARMATEAAAFVRRHLYDDESGELFRRWRDGERKIAATLADHAMLVEGLLALFDVTAETTWLRWAISLHERQNRLFLDADGGGYFTSLAQSDLLLRLKDEGDNVIPSGNAVAARNGFRLAKLLGREDFYDAARQTLAWYAEGLRLHPSALAGLVLALDESTRSFPQIVIVGPPDDARVDALASRARRRAPPESPVLVFTPETASAAAEMLPAAGGMTMRGGEPTAFVCRDFTCAAPTTDPAEMERQIGGTVTADA